MENDRASSFQTVVCMVCQGFGDLKSPRGAIVETVERYRNYGRYLYIYVHHLNFETLRRSSWGGCHICEALCNQLGEMGTIPHEFAVPPSRSQSLPRPRSRSVELIATRLAELAKQQEGQRIEDEIISLLVHCDDETGPRRNRSHDKSVQIFTGISRWPATTWNYFNTPCDPLDPIMEHRPSRDLLSKPHIGLINRWMNTCNKEHLSCRRNVGNKQLPRRVIELLDSSNEDHGVRLIETHPKMQGTYACLSYCWGDPELQTGQVTKRSNLLSQYQGISYQDLPHTAVDIIRLCYKLGFRFLWIDRLCIIQDDESDWLTESSQMCNIYSNSTLTISVPICSQLLQSFLAERLKDFRKEEEFYTISYTDEKSKLRHGLWMYPQHSLKDGPWFLEQDWDSFCSRMNWRGSRWLDRGWTFQEWMLSPRVLHIDSMTLWDCFEGYANELSRRRIEKVRLPRDSKYFGTDVSWASIVEEYSKRKITFQKDRLPALAGLAARYGQVTGYTYLAGLWLEEMPISLLWICGADCRVSDALRGANPAAPSWSWACSDGGIQTFQLQPEYQKYRNRFTASAFVVSYCQYNGLGFPSSVEKSWINVKGYCSAVKEWKSGLDFIYTSDDEYWGTSRDDESSVMGETIKQNLESVYLLLIGVFDTTNRPQHYALVLQQCGLDDGQPCFRRLGRATARRIGRRTPGPFFPTSGLAPSWQQRTVRLV